MQRRIDVFHLEDTFWWQEERWSKVDLSDPALVFDLPVAIFRLPF